MNASPALLLLFLLSLGHGKEQDDSPAPGILAAMKAHGKPTTSYESSCPEHEHILPCVCSIAQGRYAIMDCSDVQDEDQLRKVFSAFFPKTDLFGFQMRDNMGVKVLEDGVFGNVSFQAMYFEGGALETISSDALTPSFTTLNGLYVHNCPLATFPFVRLPQLTSLYLLSLSINKIQSLPMLSSPSLQYLLLGNNAISYVSPYSFTFLPNIKWITLNSNNLTEIASETFQFLPNLFYVDLSGNALQSLKNSTFGVVTHGFIDLSHNNIESVEEDTFKDVAIRSMIDMSYNALTTFDEAWKPVLQKESFVYLKENKFTCGCDLAWLVRNPQLFGMVGGARCADGRVLRNLDPDDFENCE